MLIPSGISNALGRDGEGPRRPAAKDGFGQTADDQFARSTTVKINSSKKIASVEA